MVIQNMGLLLHYSYKNNMKTPFFYVFYGNGMVMAMMIV